MTRSGRGAAALFAVVLLAAASTVVGVAAVRPTGAKAKSRVVASPATPTRPNILLLVADDQTASTFSRANMPNVFSQLVDKGVTFDQAYVNTSLCCPSRAQVFTGLDGTDTNVSDNLDILTRPTVIQALQNRGYRTVLAGKYLNSQPCLEENLSQFDETYCYGRANSDEVDPVIDVNGKELPFHGYSADILANYVKHFIATTPSNQPFFAVYTPKDPHLPANDDRFNNLPVPTYRPPSFDEDTQNDNKPAYMQRPPLRTSEIAKINSNYTDMYRTSRGLDNAIGGILSSLGPRADNTLVIYMSDNGFMYGEHRKAAEKIVPYQESVKVPMVVRDPLVRPESLPIVSHALVENTDLAPTIADTAGVTWHADGQSLVPVLAGNATSVRDGALIEYCTRGLGRQCWSNSPSAQKVGNAAASQAVPRFLGLVTSHYKYITYATGEKELYDLQADPYELVNHAGQAAWSDTQAALAGQLADLEAHPPPQTTIATGPAPVVAPGPQSFTYFTQIFDATYQCRLSSDSDPGSWAPCGAENTTVGPLDPGNYVFRVAGDDNGNIDPTPAQWSFTVDGSLPVASVSDSTVKEAAPANARFESFTISLDHASASSVSVEYRTDDGGAASPADYTSTSGVATFDAGDTQTVVKVPVVDDALNEQPESFNFRIFNPNGASIVDDTGVRTITDNDPAPTVSVGPASVTEGTGTGGTLEFPVTLDAPSGNLVRVSYHTTPGTAKAGRDFTSKQGLLKIAPGQTVVYAPVPVVGDSLYEPDETMSLTLTAPFATRLGVDTATGTIVDDDQPPTVAVANSTVVEGDNGHTTLARIPLTLPTPSTQPVAITYHTADGTATAGSDYVATTHTSIIKTGSTRAVISIPVIGDNLVEGDETFTVNFDAVQNATIGHGHVTVTIYDNDSPPEIAVSDTSVTPAPSGTTKAQFAVSLTVPSTTPVTVDFSTADGTAVSPTNYTAKTGTVTFPPGKTTSSISVPVKPGAPGAPDVSFTVALGDPVNGTIVHPSATGTIILSKPAVSVASSPDVTEGDSGTTNAVFTVSIPQATPLDVSVDYATADGSATAPTEYVATSGTLTIPAGSTSGTVSVPVVGDTRYEHDESFSLNLSNPVNATLGTAAGAAKIVDDDTPPEAAFLGDVFVPEGDSGTTNAVFTVVLSAASGLPTTVDYSTSDVTATAPADYTAVSSSLVIPPGATNGTFSVPVVGDTLFENQERFLAQITDVTNGTVAQDDYGAYGVIGDDDPTPVVSVADPQVTEGDSGTTAATFTISLDTVSGADTTVFYQTADGTATAGSDYEAASGSVVIPAGSTSATVDVDVDGDTFDEPNETFTLDISTPVDALLGTDTATGTILNDDPAPVLNPERAR